MTPGTRGCFDTGKGNTRTMLILLLYEGKPPQWHRWMCTIKWRNRSLDGKQETIDDSQHLIA